MRNLKRQTASPQEFKASFFSKQARHSLDARQIPKHPEETSYESFVYDGKYLVAVHN